MMIGANLALLLLLGQAPASDPFSLVAQLGSSRYAQREAAAGALERLGQEALPALRSAKDAKDPEIRSRASTLITRIEGALLTHPKLVRLDFDDRPLAEAVKAVSDQAGLRLALFPEQNPAWQARRITLREPSPLPFWKALDRLCEAGELQYNFGGMHGAAGGRESVFPLFAGGVRPAGPMSDSGPFRVNLVGLHYQRVVSFLPTTQTVVPNRVAPPAPPAGGAPARPEHSVSEQFYAQIQVAAEPRLVLSQSGDLKIQEAVDDRDQSLLVSTDGNGVTQRFSGYFGITSGATLHLQVPLTRPEHPGSAIKRLRGVLPVIVATRKADPLVVPLAGAPGKSFHNEEATLTVQDVRVNPATHQTSIELSIRPNQAEGRGPETGAFPAPGLAGRPDGLQQQIDVLDSQGRTILWYHANDAEGSRMTLTLTPSDQGPPAEIRYYAMARAQTEVKFEFTDVPLP